MSKKIIFFVFALVLIAVPIYIIFSSEAILEKGHQHKVKLEGFDPFDPFRGKYLMLNYDFSVDCDQTMEEGDAGFVVLEKDENGFSYFSKVTIQAPIHDDYVKCTVYNVYNGKAEIQLDNIGKYFINESKAKSAEELLMESVQIDSNGAYATIRVLNGECRLEEVYVKGKPLKSFFQ
ncbi:MAG: hypothetical protein RI922_312 [Bacteroidota bacterium]|jgi:hypothetical protein